MSYNLSPPSALRTLQRLTGTELYSQWRGSSRGFTSLSAASQAKWDHLAEWVTEHAIMFIDVTKQVEARGGGTGSYDPKPTPIDPKAAMGMRISDEDIAAQAELFLKGAVAIQEAERDDQAAASVPDEIEAENPEENPVVAAIDALAVIWSAALKKLLA